MFLKSKLEHLLYFKSSEAICMFKDKIMLKWIVKIGYNLLIFKIQQSSVSSVIIILN